MNKSIDLENFLRSLVDGNPDALGAMFTDMEGNPLAMLLPSALEPEILAQCTLQAIKNARAFAETMALGEIQQLLLFTTRHVICAAELDQRRLILYGKNGKALLINDVL